MPMFLRWHESVPVPVLQLNSSHRSDSVATESANFLCGRDRPNIPQLPEPFPLVCPWYLMCYCRDIWRGTAGQNVSVSLRLYSNLDITHTIPTCAGCGNRSHLHHPCTFGNVGPINIVLLLF